MTPIRRLHRVMSVLVALVLGYSGHAAGQGTEAERRCRQIDALAAQLRCVEQITIATNPGRALRYGSGVFITTERRIHARIDWPGTPASPDTAYFYQGLEPRLNAHQLRVVILSGRSGHHELIHQRTGQVTLLAGQPAIGRQACGVTSGQASHAAGGLCTGCRSNPRSRYRHGRGGRSRRGA